MAGRDMVAVTTADGGCLIRLAGELDLVTAPDVRPRLRAAIDAAGCRDTGLDLTDLGFVDAAGLAVLLDAAAYARGRCCSWVVVGMGSQVRRIISVTGTGEALGVG